MANTTRSIHTVGKKVFFSIENRNHVPLSMPQTLSKMQPKSKGLLQQFIKWLKIDEVVVEALWISRNEKFVLPLARILLHVLLWPI